MTAIHSTLIRNERQPRRLRLPRTQVQLILLLSILGAAAVMATGLGRAFDVVIAWMMYVAVVVVASQRPMAAVPALFVVYASNRLIRRLLDYAEGEYAAFPPTSLVVPALGLTLGFLAVCKWRTLPKNFRKGVLFYLLAIGYGLIVGVRYGVAAAFEAVEWLGPLGVGLYVLWLRPDWHDLRRWVAVIGVMAAVAMVYGWIQWRLLPPWDAFWVAECGMGSIGHAEPGRSRFFGSFGAMGAAGGTAAWAAAALVMTRSLPATIRWPIVGFLAISSLATKVRSAWIAAVAAVCAWLLCSKGKHRIPAILGMAVAVGALVLIIPQVPDSQHMLDRAGSLQDIGSDGSFRGRVAFTWWALGEVIQRPIGHGLGSTSLMGVRSGETDLAAFDSGYAQPLYALGLPGSALLAISLAYMFGPLFRSLGSREKSGGEVMNFARAVVFGHAFAMLVSNVLRTEGAMLLWIAIAAAHVALTATPRKARVQTPSSATRLTHGS